MRFSLVLVASAGRSTLAVGKSVVETLLVVVVLIASPLVVRSVGANLNGPDDPLVRLEPGRPAGGESPAGSEPALLFALYQNLLGTSRGSRCPMEPSCSQFSKEAMQRCGPLLGLVLTADRLLRCGRDLHYYRTVWTARGGAFADSIP